jgi:hypothetical protein
MNPLKELIHILEQNKNAYLQNWLFQNNGTNLVKLYYGMLNNTFQDDDAASIALYGKAGAAAFHKLKFDLKTQLYDAIPFIEIKLKNKNDAETERFRYHNLLMSFNILIQLSGNAAAVEMGEYIYENCVKLGFTDLAYIAAKRISGKTNQKKLAFYSAEVKRLHQLEGIELEAKIYYDEILILYRNDKLNKEELRRLVEAKRDAFMEIKGDLSSPVIKVYVYLLELCVHSIKNDAKALFDTALRGATYFEQLPIRYTQALKSYYFYLIVGYSQRKAFDTAVSYIDKCLLCVAEGTTGWLKVLELAYVSHLHSGNYNLATETWLKATNNTFLKSYPPHIQEKWMIYYAFLHFLILSDAYIPTEKQKAKLKKDFKLAQFKNSLIFYEKEKSGMNLNILLLEILFLIKEKKYDELLERYEAIQKYLQRYIDDTESRSRIKMMFKLLLLCIKHHFKHKMIETPAEAILTALLQQSTELGDEAYELEIIPYEKVWELVSNTFTE